VRGANQLLVIGEAKEGGTFPTDTWRVDMALTPEQHSEIASAYESAAADSFISAEQRAVFARKAELFRLLAKLASKQAASARQKAPRPPKAADIRRKILDNLAERRHAPSATRADPETPAHVQALTQLALRWRLFRLETRTFGRYAPLHARPAKH
jgi:hypothetical protein